MAEPDVDRALPSLMAQLAEDGATGVLVARADDTKREIIFVDGEIRAARSDLEDEKLGLWLVHRKKVSENDRALTLLAQGGGDSPPLGHILVTRGYLPQEDLEIELQELALEIIRKAVTARNSGHEFIEGDGGDQLDTLPNITTPEITLLAARELEDIDAVRREIGPPEQPVRLAGSLQDMLDGLVLTPTEGFLLSRLDGANDIASLIKISSLPEDEAYSTLYALIISGAVVIGERRAVPRIQKAAKRPRAKGPLDEPSAVAAAAEPVEEEALTDRQREERNYVRKLSDEVTKIDHYRALGLRADASRDEITEAWKKIQKRYAPSRSGEEHLRDMATHLERIVERGREAYELLSDLRARRRYDRILETVERERRALDGGGRAKADPKARAALVEANLKRADELVHDGELYLAIQLLEQACALDPRPAELLKLARLLLRNPLWTNRALTCMRRAIEADPKHAAAWIELAEFWRRRRHSERQRKALERALAVDPDNKNANEMYRDLVGKKELERLLRRARQMH
jgi:curved DNA-binding protein CbpA